MFQACYGSPQDYFSEEGFAPLRFIVQSGETGEALPGIKVSACEYDGNNYMEVGQTDKDGILSANIPYLRNQMGPYVRFEDPDGNFAVKDTSFTDLRPRDIVIKL